MSDTFSRDFDILGAMMNHSRKTALAVPCLAAAVALLQGCAVVSINSPSRTSANTSPVHFEIVWRNALQPGTLQLFVDSLEYTAQLAVDTTKAMATASLPLPVGNHFVSVTGSFRSNNGFSPASASENFFVGSGFFNIKAPTAATRVLPGDTSKATIGVTRSGSFTGPVALTVSALPNGISSNSPLTVPIGQSSADVLLTGAGGLSFQDTAALVTGTGMIDGQPLVQSAYLPLKPQDSLGWTPLRPISTGTASYQMTACPKITSYQDAIGRGMSMIFTLDQIGGIWVSSRTPSPSLDWAPFSSLGFVPDASFKNLAIARSRNTDPSSSGPLRVFMIDAIGNLKIYPQQSFFDDAFDEPVKISLPPPSGVLFTANFTAAVTGLDRAYLFVVGSEGSIWYASETVPRCADASCWTPWARLPALSGPVASSIVVVNLDTALVGSTANGPLDVFVKTSITSDNANIIMSSHQSALDGSWTQWHNVSPFDVNSEPVVGRQYDGTLALLYSTQDGIFYTTTLEPPGLPAVWVKIRDSGGSGIFPNALASHLEPLGPVGGATSSHFDLIFTQLNPSGQTLNDLRQDSDPAQPWIPAGDIGTLQSPCSPVASTDADGYLHMATLDNSGQVLTSLNSLYIHQGVPTGNFARRK